jgi:hypothetical protein
MGAMAAYVAPAPTVTAQCDQAHHRDKAWAWPKNFQGAS